MSKRSVILFLAILVSACSGGETGRADPTPTAIPQLQQPNPTLAESPPPPPTIRQPEPCEHLLWPVVDGASWDYQLRRSDGNVQIVRLSASVNADIVTFALVSESAAVESTMTCAPDGFYGALGGLIGHPDLGLALELSNPDRPYLPSPDRLLPLGTTTAWDAQFDAGGAIDLPFASGVQQAAVTGGDVVLYASAEQLETISIPAGTFNALPVTESILFNLQVTTAEGLSGSVFGDAQVRLYWAEGVGLVRQVFQGGMLSSTLLPEPIILPSGISLELVDYQPPGE